jgi:hypothetical protein
VAVRVAHLSKTTSTSLGYSTSHRTASSTSAPSTIAGLVTSRTRVGTAVGLASTACTRQRVDYNRPSAHTVSSVLHSSLHLEERDGTATWLEPAALLPSGGPKSSTLVIQTLILSIQTLNMMKK